MMTELTRIIKKYPNRRLYDTQTSSYVTLDDLRQYIINGSPFQVIDSKSEEDITRSILLQIILDQEATQTPIFSTQVLLDMIRGHENAYSGLMSQFLESGLQYFLKQQDQMQQRMGTEQVIRTLTEQNLTLIKSFQEQWFDGLNSLMKTKPKDPPTT